MSTSKERSTGPSFAPDLQSLSVQESKTSTAPPPAKAPPSRDFKDAIVPGALILTVVCAVVALLRQRPKPATSFRGVSPASVLQVAFAGVLLLIAGLYLAGQLHWRDLARSLMPR